MNLYIAKNGQRLGPFELAEAQNMVANGTIKATDLAWHKGLPGWVPLRQIAGLTLATPERPLLVWISCGIYLALILWGLGASLWFLFHFAIPSASNASQVQAHVNYSSFVVRAAMNLVKLGGLVLLFRLRRSALYVLGGVFGVSLFFVFYQMGVLFLHASYSPFFFAETIFFNALNLIMLAYVWHLFRTGVLR